MSSKAEKDKAKQLQDKCQSVLNGLLRDEDNKYCVDCDSKGPRWASWNIGIFLCIRCAGIHRNLGVHISKVKSVNLDAWTPEQVVSLQQMGNSRARAVYEANLPDNFRRPQSDSALESFIRAKYEHKKYIAREWVPPALPKVNWEKEIEEEMERQKRKKKTIVEKKLLSSVEVPQLPKPTNPSPKPNRAVNNSTPDTKEKKDDLLGLQNGEDNFSNFLSAPPSTNKEAKTKEEADPAKSEEESFFNQTLPTEKEKVKLDKDSILALYGSGPTIPTNTFNQFQSPIVAPVAPIVSTQVPFQPVQGFQAPAQTNFTGFGGFPQPQQTQNFVPLAPNGVQQFNTQWNAQGQWNKPPVQYSAQNQVQYVPPTQVPSYNTSTPQVPQVNSQFGQFQQPSPNANATATAATFNQVSNPFFTNPNTLTQQFNNMSIATPPANTAPMAAPTVATNIWQ